MRAFYSEQSSSIWQSTPLVVTLSWKGGNATGSPFTAQHNFHIRLSGFKLFNL